MAKKILKTEDASSEAKESGNIQPDESNLKPQGDESDTTDNAAENDGQEGADEAQIQIDDTKPTEGITEADEVFASNPKLDVYWKTSDDTAFYTDNAANLWASKLEDKTVIKITRK